MDYKEKVIAILNSQELSKEQKEKLENIFPELKDSEDEKVKRIIYSIVTKMSFHVHDIFTEEEFQCFDAWCHTWLEKQDECSWKPTEEQFEALDYAYNSCSDTERGNYYEGVLADLIADLRKLYEKQDEKKKSEDNKSVDRVIGTADHIKTALDVLNKKGGEE